MQFGLPAECEDATLERYQSAPEDIRMPLVDTHLHGFGHRLVRGEQAAARLFQGCPHIWNTLASVATTEREYGCCACGLCPDAPHTGASGVRGVPQFRIGCMGCALIVDLAQIVSLHTRPGLRGLTYKFFLGKRGHARWPWANDHVHNTHHAVTKERTEEGHYPGGKGSWSCTSTADYTRLTAVTDGRA